MNRRLPIFAVLMMLYVVCITVGCVLYYFSAKSQGIAKIDQGLLAARIALQSPRNQADIESVYQQLSAAEVVDGYYFLQPNNFSISQVFPSESMVDMASLEGGRSDLQVQLNGLPDGTGGVFTFHPFDKDQRLLIYADVTSDSWQVLTHSIGELMRSVGYELLTIISLSLLFLVVCVPLLLHYRTRQQDLVQAVIKAANTDTLTGLPNKQQLLTDLEATTAPNLAFIKILNYNSFIINYGPAVVSDIIRQFSAVLSRFYDPRLKNSFVYRVEPSTFAILEDQDIAAHEIADITAEIVKSLMLHEYQIGDGEHARINLTVGGVNQKNDAYTLAKMALQEAEYKKLPYYFINKDKSSLPEQYRKDQQLLREMLSALNNGRLKAFYHPIFANDGKTVTKYECLARLVNQDSEVIMMPDVFLPLAHRANVYYKFTRTILTQVIDFVSQNQVVVSININVSDINNKKTRSFIYQSLKDSGMGSLIEFELLEDEAIIETSLVIAFMLKVQKLGAKIGMDDLGKGYSNIERLINLPIDFVKIDKSIMENLTHNLEMQSIAKSIIRLAHKKNLKVTAEYCADEMITKMAIDLGADYLQGFYLATPAPQLFEANWPVKKQQIN